MQSQEKTTVLSLAPRLQCALIAGCADFYTGGGRGAEKMTWNHQPIMLLLTLMWTAGRGRGNAVESGKSKTNVSKVSCIASMALDSPAVCTSPCPNCKILFNPQAPRTLQHYLFFLLPAEGSTSTLSHLSAEHWRTTTCPSVSCKAVQLLHGITAMLLWLRAGKTPAERDLGTCLWFPSTKETEHLMSFNPFLD